MPKASQPMLDRLYIATTAKRDAVLQKKVREISEQRAKAGLFKIDVLFWDDICQDLAKDDDIFFRHYPQFRQGTDPITVHDKKLFVELTALLSSDGVIGFIDRTNMAGFLFRDAELDPLTEFHERWNTPERQFITPELEAGSPGALVESQRLPRRDRHARPFRPTLQAGDRYRRNGRKSSRNGSRRVVDTASCACRAKLSTCMPSLCASVEST